MTTAADLLADAFRRIGEDVAAVVDGLTPDELRRRVTPDANPIGWLVWHLLRVQDDHVADAARTEQVWLTARWNEDFALPFEPTATGYGQSSDEVASVAATAEQLAGYGRAVTAATQAYVATLSNGDLDRVVDARWDPPVTLAVRLVSVVQDDLKHLGQAELLRGLL